MSNNNAAAVIEDSLEPIKDVPLDEYDKELVSLSRHFLKLPGAYRQIVRYFIENYESGDMLTNAEIARKANVHPVTVSKAMINADFCACMSEILPQIMRSRSPFLIGKLIKHADTSVKAIELWTRFTGEYKPTDRHENININIEFSDDQAGKLDGILMKLLELGHSPEDVYMRMSELTGKVLDMPAEPAKAKGT